MHFLPTVQTLGKFGVGEAFEGAHAQHLLLEEHKISASSSGVEIHHMMELELLDLVDRNRSGFNYSRTGSGLWVSLIGIVNFAIAGSEL